MSMLDKAKLALRISAINTAYDTEVQDLIDASKMDLSLAGVMVIDEEDPLISRAICAYCKANFGWDNSDSEKLQNAFESIKNRLTMAADYNTEVT